MNFNEFKENAPTIVEVADGIIENDHKSFKREKSRFEFALYINDFLVCKRNFPIDGYIEKSMSTPEFKSEVDKIVDLIDGDLKAKSRVYTWYHYPEFKFVEGAEVIPDWEPEIMTNPLSEEGMSVLKFVVYDNGKEVISKIWDGRYYPLYVRKNIDLTNRQVKITKGEKTNIYDKEKFFEDHGNQLYGDLYVLRQMIIDKDNLVPTIQKIIYEVCSSYDGYYEKLSDYHINEDYYNRDYKRDADGNPMFDDEGKHLFDAPKKAKKYTTNIDAYNRKVDSNWGAVVSEKTRKYMSELYIQPKEKTYKKKVK